jgi:hypothetical protein
MNWGELMGLWLLATGNDAGLESSSVFEFIVKLPGSTANIGRAKPEGLSLWCKGEGSAGARFRDHHGITMDGAAS